MAMMPGKMPPQEQMGQMPAQGAEQEKNPPEGDVGSLVARIGGGMEQLLEMMSQSQVVDPTDKEKLGAILQAFTGLIEDMSKAPAPANAKNTPIRSSVPMEAGVKGKAENPAGYNF